MKCTKEVSLSNCIQRISELECENASLQAYISKLEKQIAQQNDYFPIKNDLLREIVELSSDRIRGVTRNKPYNGIIQKFALTTSTYSPKCYR